MATADPMTQVNEILKCVICWDRYTDSRQLSCGHEFCFECINTHFKTYGKNCAPCPICRKLYWPKDRNVNNLPKSTLPLRQLLAIQHSTERSCDTLGCKHNKAPYLCLACRQWLCDACKTQTCISENDDNITHNAFVKSDIDPGLFDIVKRSRHKHCYTHHSKEIEWYCLQCKMLLCEMCTNNHLHHTRKDIATQSSDTRKNLEQTAVSLQKKQQRHQTDLDLYTDLQIVVKVELFNASNCQNMMTMCSRDIENCDKLIQLITQLLKFGSDVVIIDTYHNLEERIETEMRQCHSLEPLLTELNNRMTDNNHTTATWVTACHTEQRKHLISDSGVDDLSVSEGSLEEGVPPEDNPCEMSNCVSSAKTNLLCLSCRKWICEGCSRRRCLQNGPDAKHELLPVADIDSRLYAVIMRNRNHFCKLHPSNDVSLFCKKCNIPLCPTCRVNGGHLDHPTMKISDRSQVCCRKLKRYEEKLQKQVKDYKTTRHKFLEMQNSPSAEALNSLYCENITIRCESGIDACDDFVKRITFLLHYGSPSVIVDEFCELKDLIENELKVCPSDLSTPLRQLVGFICDTLDHANSCVNDAATSDDEAEDENTREEVQQGMHVNGPASNQTNSPVTNGPESNQTNTPVANDLEGNQTNDSEASGLDSNPTNASEANDLDSSAMDIPIVNGSGSSASHTTVVNRQRDNAPVRRRVTTTVRNAANDVPNNPNSSEESNAKAHVSYAMMIWEQIKAMFRYLSRFFSGS